MAYKIIVTADAEADLDAFVRYLLFEKKNEQAASNLIDDFEATKATLENVAVSLRLCENPYLNELGYRRINFMSHRYFMLYRVDKDTVCIDNIFHELQDFENRMMQFLGYTSYGYVLVKQNCNTSV